MTLKNLRLQGNPQPSFIKVYDFPNTNIHSLYVLIELHFISVKNTKDTQEFHTSLFKADAEVPRSEGTRQNRNM